MKTFVCSAYQNNVEEVIVLKHFGCEIYALSIGGHHRLEA